MAHVLYMLTSPSNLRTCSGHSRSSAKTCIETTGQQARRYRNRYPQHPSFDFECSRSRPRECRLCPEIDSLDTQAIKRSFSSDMGGILRITTPLLPLMSRLLPQKVVKESIPHSNSASGGARSSDFKSYISSQVDSLTGARRFPSTSIEIAFKTARTIRIHRSAFKLTKFERSSLR